MTSTVDHLILIEGNLLSSVRPDDELIHAMLSNNIMLSKDVYVIGASCGCRYGWRVNTIAEVWYYCLRLVHIHSCDGVHLSPVVGNDVVIFDRTEG